MIKKLYLFLFNLISFGGWAYCHYLFWVSVIAQDSPEDFWAKVGKPLNITQALALFEVVHSLFRVVKSPLVTTAIQVTSRVVLLWFISNKYEVCQGHWSLYLMAGSWSLSELPRYLFYAINLYTKVPYVLLWMRYSFFMMLYPTGITGEITQILTSLSLMKVQTPIKFYIFIALLLSYIPGSPMMIGHMWKQRQKVLRKKKKDKKKKEK